MRFLILKDKDITSSDLASLQKEFTDFINKNTGLTPTFFIEEQEYKDIPTTTDSDGDLKPTTAYMQALMKKVHDKYGDYGVDSVVMLVHRDNWIFKGIWGSNFSNQYYKYHVHLCRFDHKNVANSLGTLYHEWMHSLDVLIKTHTGVDINDYFKNTACYESFDTTIVHGNKYSGCATTPYKYIKWKDNTDALKLIAPDLKKAYEVRKELYLEPLKTVQLRIISFLRGLINKKNGTSGL